MIRNNKPKMKALKFFDKRNIGSLPRIFISSILVVFFFYSAPLIINFAYSSAVNVRFNKGIFNIDRVIIKQTSAIVFFKALTKNGDIF